MKMALKLYTFIGGIVVVAFIVFGIYIYDMMSKQIASNYTESINEYLSNFVKMADLEYQAKKERLVVANNLASSYMESLGSITKTNDMVTVGTYTLNQWFINNKPVQNHYDIVDYIQSKGIDVATIFQKIDEGYVRVSTNVLTKENKRAVGTILTYESPVVQALERGETFHGRAFVVNSWYLTTYVPIKLNGAVIGAYFIGVPEMNYTGLSSYFKEKKYFGSGYPYIIDSKGVLTAHPKSVGKDLSKESFFQEMTELKNGVVTYMWEGREKTQYFKYLENIDSYVTVGFYTEDYNAVFSNLRTVLIIATILALLIVMSVIFFIVKGVLRQLGGDPKEVQDIANKVAEGDLNINLTLRQGDVSSLLYSMDRMVRIVKLMVSDTKNLGESASAGKLDVSADVSKFKGEFAELVAGINGTLDAVIKPLNVTAEYVDRISKGDIPPKIQDEYQGDFNEIKNNLNSCIDSINLLVIDTKDLVHSTTLGKLNDRADAGNHFGEFKTIIQGVNSSLDRLVGLIDKLPVAVQIVDKNFNMLYKNKKSEEIKF